MSRTSKARTANAELTQAPEVMIIVDPLFQLTVSRADDGKLDVDWRSTPSRYVPDNAEAREQANNELHFVYAVVLDTLRRIIDQSRGDGEAARLLFFMAADATSTSTTPPAEES